MRTKRFSIIAATALTATVSLTGCHSSSSSTSSGDAASAASTAAAAGGSGGSSGTTPSAAAKTDAATKAATGSGPSASAKNGSGSGARHCTAGNLDGSIAPGSGAQAVDSKGFKIVKLTNTGSSTCVMKGFPGVDLVKGDGESWSLPRQKPVTPKKVTLAPGTSAYFSIVYLSAGSKGDVVYDVDKIVVTPPNDTHELTLTWKGAEPQDASMASNPITFLKPITATNPAH